MKTTIKSIKKTIEEYCNDVNILKYYVEDENEINQKIVIFGSTDKGHIYGCLIGNDLTKEHINENIKITNDYYEAKYMFRLYI